MSAPALLVDDRAAVRDLAPGRLPSSPDARGTACAKVGWSGPDPLRSRDGRFGDPTAGDSTVGWAEGAGAPGPVGKDPVDGDVQRLACGGFWRMVGGRGLCIEVLSGRLWLTEEGGVEDHFLVAGMRHVIRGDGRVVGEADVPGVTVIRVSHTAPGSVRERRPGVDPAA